MEGQKVGQGKAQHQRHGPGDERELERGQVGGEADAQVTVVGELGAAFKNGKVVAPGEARQQLVLVEVPETDHHDQRQRDDRQDGVEERRQRFDLAVLIDRSLDRRDLDHVAVALVHPALRHEVQHGDDRQQYDAADQAADSRKAELDELLAGPIDDSDDGVPTANPYQLMAQLGSVMEQALAVRCTAQTIDTALTQINGDITPVADTLRAHDKTAAFNQEVTAIWEVRHLIELAEVMLHASESRQESRGSMQRLDFPERDDEHFLAHSMVADDGSVSFKPVHITDYPPKKREY